MHYSSGPTEFPTEFGALISCDFKVYFISPSPQDSWKERAIPPTPSFLVATPAVYEDESGIIQFLCGYCFQETVGSLGHSLHASPGGFQLRDPLLFPCPQTRMNIPRSPGRRSQTREPLLHQTFHPSWSLSSFWGPEFRVRWRRIRLDNTVS